MRTTVAAGYSEGKIALALRGQMNRVLLLGLASAVLLVSAALDPTRRYIYLFFAFLGLVGTLRARRRWQAGQNPDRPEGQAPPGG